MTSLKELSSTRKLAYLGVFAALATALMYIEIPYPFSAFLRIDLSDVVVIVVAVLIGLKEGVLIAFIKAFIHLLFPGLNPTFGIGELAAFIASITYILSFVTLTNKLNLNVILSSVISIVVMSLTLTFFNWILFVPLYDTLYLQPNNLIDIFKSFTANYPYLFDGEYMKFVFGLFIPFNLIKGTIIYVLFFAVNKSLKLIEEKQTT